MVGLIFWLLVFIVSLTILSKSADYFTNAAEKIGLFLGFSPFIVGVTIVALGTSLPELISSVLSVIRDSSEIVAGNVVGSNITNIFLILGVAVIVGRKLKISHELINVDLPIFTGSSFLLVLTLWDGRFTFLEGILCLVFFVVYISYTINSGRKKNALGREEHIIAGIKRKKKALPRKDLFVLFGSLFFVFLGANFTIESIIKLSEILDIGKEIIAASVVALGTSLPELIVSISAARRGKAEIAIGNILGSNIFNSLAVMGISSMVGVLVIPSSIIFFGIPILLTATLLYFFITQDRQITRWEGWMLIVFYVFYIGKLFGLV